MPKFTLSKSIILDQYKKIKEIADVVTYSSKTNPLVTPILEEYTDTMFSIHLKNELKNVKDLSRVWFFAQAWNKEEVQDLFNKGVRSFVVDNEPDLDTLLEVIPTLGEKVNLLLRAKLREMSIKTERYFVFGITSKIINERIRTISQNESLMKNIDQLGLHVHRKTQNMSEWRLAYEFEHMIDEDVWSLINTINIGGGIPSAYANTNKNVIENVFKTISELKSHLNEKNIKLIIEPGRAIAAPAGKLYTKVKGIHENTIIIDASVYNSDMDALIVPVKLLIEEEVEKAEGEPYIVKGITPCSLDLFRYRVYLKDPKIGDTITFINAGAYNFSTDFCDLEVIETEIVE